MTTLLIVVDVQPDFLPGGPLGVPDGDAVIPEINRLAPVVDGIVCTQDWHPADHLSFAANHPGRAVGERVDVAGLEQILWPVHCVQGTPGAELAAGLDLPGDPAVFRKGTDRTIDSYSGFFDNGRRRGTGLAEHVAALAPDDVIVTGLATDYCVRFTVEDACSLGHRVTVVTDAVRGVELEAGDVERALASMHAAGARLATTDDVVQTIGSA